MDRDVGLDLDLDLSSAPPDRISDDSLLFIFHEGRILVSEEPQLPVLPEGHPQQFCADGFYSYIGIFSGRAAYLVVPGQRSVTPAGFYAESLRKLLHMVDEPVFCLASRASQIASWYLNHRYCCRCGGPTSVPAVGHGMACRRCSHTQYPRITPCVIVLITRGEEALLARAARFPAGFYSCLAGFLEAGESAEQAVVREVYEETGIRIANLVYHASQSWPFPHALMLGFHAQWAAGDIRVDGEEILDAHWYHFSKLPMIPPKGSIARALIDTWVNRVTKRTA